MKTSTGIPPESAYSGVSNLLARARRLHPVVECGLAKIPCAIFNRGAASRIRDPGTSSTSLGARLLSDVETTQCV